MFFGLGLGLNLGFCLGLGLDQILDLGIDIGLLCPLLCLGRLFAIVKVLLWEVEYELFHKFINNIVFIDNF